MRKPNRECEVREGFLEDVASIVLAGGQGTRLMPLTAKRCKPAVSFGGRYRLIDIPLSNSINSNIRRIYVIGQCFASGLNQHILSTYQFNQLDKGSIELITPQETTSGKEWFKGTADAVRQNLDYFLQDPAEYFLILSGDQLYNIDFAEMIHFAKREDADLIVAALPILEKEAPRMGLMKVNEKSQIQDFIEKPKDPKLLEKFVLPNKFLKSRHISDPSKPHYLASMGIYVFKRQALIDILKEEGDDFGHNIIPKQMRKGKSSAYLYSGYWEDIGTVSSYYDANLALTQIPIEDTLDIHDESRPIFTHPHNLPSPVVKNTVISDSIVSQGAVLEAKEIVHSVIGIRARIKKGTIIHDSIIMGNHHYYPPPSTTATAEHSIGENCVIRKAIIDEYTSIGNNVQLINKDGHENYDGKGVFVRDGIIIVTTGTHLPDNFIF